MRRLVYITLCSALAVFLSLTSVASAKTVKVGIYQNKPKAFVDSDGKPQGFFVDILNHIASKEGWQLEYVESTWEKNLEKLEKAEIDILVDIADSQRRDEVFEFNKEIVFSNWAIVYVQEDSKIQSILDLKGKKIAVMKGDISYEDFSRNLQSLGIYATFVEVDNFSDVFELIAREEVDAGILSRLYGLQHEDEYDVVRSTIICCPRNLYFAVPKNKNLDLIKKIDQYLYDLKRDDRSIYYTSLIKWIEGFSPWKFPTWLVWLLVFSGVMLLVFSAGIVVLKLQVNTRTTELRKRNEELQAEISERKRAEEEMKQLQAQLIQAQKMEAVGTLAGGIAHDFSNSLQAIYNYLYLLKHKHSSDSPGPDYFKKILGIIDNSSHLTKQLLTVSRKIDSTLKPINLNDKILQVQTLLERTIPKRIKIELNLAKDLKIIPADKGQIEQILLNLTLNASHAISDEGQISIETRNVKPNRDFAEIHGVPDAEEYVLLSVADTGHGIATDVKNRIFEPFFTTKSAGQGTGLGLSMVYGIVKNHQGHIECESEPGGGTRFNIYFPVTKTKIAPKDEISSKKEAIPTGHETILLVEDNESILDGVTRMLQHFGYTVFVATTGEKSIEIYEAEREGIDLVILDLNMPGMGGYKCLERLLEIDPNLKTIITSGYTPPENFKTVRMSKSFRFIEKPYQIEDLVGIIREVLDGTDKTG